MANRLSYSQASTYAECSQKWEYRYRHGLRSKDQSAALCFGTALDAAVSQLLQPKDQTTPEEALKKSWTHQELNKVLVHLPTSLLIVYSEADIDLELLGKAAIKELAAVRANPIEEFKTIQEAKETVGWQLLPDEHKSFYNLVAWHVMLAKGLIMLKGFRKEVLPNIEEVLSVQEKVELSNDSGDSVVGYVDFVVRYKGFNEPIVFDLKTSSIAYSTDSVLTSPQLTLYMHAVCEKYKTRRAGYVVLNKRIHKNKEKVCSVCEHEGTGSRAKTCDNEIEGKRCGGNWDVKLKPTCFVQIITDEIPERTEDIVLENLQFINESIDKGVVHRNFGACVKYGGKVRCEFYNKCFHNKDDGLIKV